MQQRESWSRPERLIAHLALGVLTAAWFAVRPDTEPNPSVGFVLLTEAALLVGVALGFRLAWIVVVVLDVVLLAQALAPVVPSSLTWTVHQVACLLRLALVLRPWPPLWPLPSATSRRMSAFD